MKKSINDEHTFAYRPGDQITSFILPEPSGNPVDVSRIIRHNKLTWINYWATWCGPCRAEMPIMAKMYATYSDKGLGMVAVDLGEVSVTVNEFLTTHPQPFSVLLDSMNTQSEALNITSIPTSLLVDSTGMILRVKRGEAKNWPSMMKRQLHNE